MDQTIKKQTLNHSANRERVPLTGEDTPYQIIVISTITTGNFIFT